MNEQNKGKRPSWYRRQWLINPEFQRHFIIFIFLVATVSYFVIFVNTLLFFARVTSNDVISDAMNDPRFSQAIDLLTKEVQSSFASMLVITAVTNVLLGLWFSHRIAGPLHRLRTSMQMISRGEYLEKVTFRKNDFFHELAEDFNQALSRLRSGGSGTKTSPLPPPGDHP